MSTRGKSVKFSESMRGQINFATAVSTKGESVFFDFKIRRICPPLLAISVADLIL